MINVLMYAAATVVILGVVIIALGPAFTELTDVANYMSGTGLLAPPLVGTLNMIFSFWVLLPVLVLVTVGFYVLRRAIRKGEYPDDY